jgi:hypothetical protein
VGPDFDLEQFFITAGAPAVAVAAAVFSFFALLAYAHLRSRALIDLLRQAIALREKQEDMKKRIGTAPLLPRFQRFEKGVRDLLAREGLRAAPPKPPSPKPATPAQGR